MTRLRLRRAALGLAVWLLPRAATAQEAPAPTETPPAASPPAPPTSSPPAAETAAAETAAAPPTDDAAGWGNVSELQQQERTFDARFYGYIDSYFELGLPGPTGAQNADGTNEMTETGYDWDLLNLHAMVQGTILQRYRFFVNLAGRGVGSPSTEASLNIRNAWVEAPIVGNVLQVRAGLTYRRFGLYNEILDATPTFIGIEPPEIFDVDHLMVTRTTNFMVHGTIPSGNSTFSYALTTGDDERSDSAVPLGGDLRWDFNNWLRLGTSFYWSGGDAVPTRAVGEGSPRGGVASWMARDNFWLTGIYAQVRHRGFIGQFEYWYAQHDAERDPAAVMQLANAGLNATQLRRFFVNGSPTAGVNTEARYNVQTLYSRLGYEIPLGVTATLTPYAQFDWYRNPEIIRARAFGGDNEAGISDSGEFMKYTLGLVWRPVQQVATKLDGGFHTYVVNGRTEFAPEIRVSFSYLWELAL